MNIFDYARKAVCREFDKDTGAFFDKLRIFQFNDLHRAYYHEGADKKDFYLPFPETAVIVGDNLMAAFRDMRENQIGFNEPRQVIFFEKFNAYDPFDPDPNPDGWYGDMLISTAFNLIDDNRAPDGVYLQAVFSMLSNARETVKYNSGRTIKEDPDFSKAARNSAGYIDDFMMLLTVINHPQNFILEKRPVNIKPRKKNKKPRAYKDRPIYTILRPDKIREQMGLPSIGTGKKRPHDRRRHVVFLSNEKYRFDENGRPIEPKVIPYGPRKGQLYYKMLIRPAVWVGPAEAKVGNHIYRVVLER